MADLLDAAREIDRFCRQQQWRHCIIGGMALLLVAQLRALEAKIRGTAMEDGGPA